MEQYIVERSEAQFSHSICPDCLKLLYPDLADGIAAIEADAQKKA